MNLTDRITEDIEDKVICHNHFEDLSVFGFRMEDQSRTGKEGIDDIFRITVSLT
jgi:hypothetical protein